ncbi:MAG: HAMP domain-containing histidine kinase [Lachnospiraceae bacterium]|nr:HAMP domain-containing histidine kinase [Lachnospiraceae bacterium]
MIKKLKRNIFWSVQLSAMAILLGFLILLNILNAIHSEQEEQKIMSSFIDLENKSQTDCPRRGRSAKLIKALVNDELSMIELNKDGEIISVIGFSSENPDRLAALTREILAQNQIQGRIGTQKYLISTTKTGITIVFSNQGMFGYHVIQTILLSIAVLLAASLLFAVLAWRLSIKLARPVEEVLEDQKRFIADASHELKTPVAIINANIAILEKETGSNKWLSFIKEASDRLSVLVGNILEYAHVDYACSSTQNDHFVHFNAAEAVIEASLPFESIAYESGLTLKLDLPDCADAVGHAEDLKQIIGILLDNAIKNAEFGTSVSLSTSTIKKRKKWRDEQIFSVSVSNLGETIPPEQLPYLFHRFYRADPSRTYDGKSFGLGLSIAHTLAEKNKGSLTVSSKDHLTVFTVMFPGV